MNWARKRAVDVHDETAGYFSAEYASDNVHDSAFRYGRSLIDEVWWKVVEGLPAGAHCLDIGSGIGAYMARHRLTPDLVLVSPAQRTLETWALVEAAFSKTPQVVKQDRIYNASTDTLADLVSETENAKALLLIGHKPGLHDLANALIGSGDVEARENLNEKLPTSGLVVIDFAFDDWSKLHEHAGRLERFVTPRLIGGSSD